MRKWNFDAIIYREGEEFIAHCLQLDIVAQAKTAEQAKRDLLDLIHVQIETAIENDNLKNLYFPAPKRYWDMLATAKVTEDAINSFEIGKLPSIQKVELQTLNA